MATRKYRELSKTLRLYSEQVSRWWSSARDVAAQQGIRRASRHFAESDSPAGIVDW